MNDSVFSRFYFQKLDSWKVTMCVVERTAVIAGALPAKCGDLGDQLRRASQSIGANLAEGMGKQGADRRRFNRIALGSAYECAAHLEMAYRIRAIELHTYDEVGALVQRVIMMLAKMSR